jgi:hypothetical protein
MSPAGSFGVHAASTSVHDAKGVEELDRFLAPVAGEVTV